MDRLLDMGTRGVFSPLTPALSPLRGEGGGSSVYYALGMSGILFGLLLAFTLRASAETNATGLAFFENHIRPQLVEHCYQCHSATAKELKGGLRLDTKQGLLAGGDSGPAIVAGDADRSLLIKAVRHTAKDLAMPRGTNGPQKLPDAVIADLARWVQMGAPYPEVSAQARSDASQTKPGHWSFQPIRKQPAPRVRNSTWPRTAIDAFILAKLEEHGLSPAAPADPRTLIRRATFDLTGLPPTPEEIDAFRADPSPDAFARVVDRLLDSPHYGERWGRHWLDVVRYADTAGDTADYPVPDAWRYRNYVIDAFNNDKPYDEFLREQVAGDILARLGPRARYAERVTATGYLAISRRFGFDSENYHHLTIQDTIDTLGQSVLGLTLGCARCHNHKYDPIPATDYYALYGIFESTRYAFPGSEQKMKYRALVPLLPRDEAEARWRGFEDRFAALDLKPAAVLRSLDDLDGDFEMQRVASGGSKGVLVPPWNYEGFVAVTQEAQSPFRNVHPFGTVGASVPSGTNAYRITQTLYPRRTPDRTPLLHVNLDFRIAGQQPAPPGHHRFWVGTSPSAPAVEVLIAAGTISLRRGDQQETLRPVPSKQWVNMQLTLDLKNRTVSGQVGAPGEVVSFEKKSFSSSWTGAIDFVAIEASGGSNGPFPGLELDNVAVQESLIPPVSAVAASKASTPKNENEAAVTDQLEKLIGLDGDFELQKHGTAPAKPWHPGPNSVVKISSDAQSPYRNVFGPGRLGIQLPNSGAYNGFGQTLTNQWKDSSTERLFASFDFRCGEQAAGGAGSWRFYLGHGNTSAAVELGFNNSQFYRRSGDARTAVAPLQQGQWYQVQLTLNLKERTYTGSLATTNELIAFEGQFANGWDGRIDYTYIDSGGHIAGVKPALAADNFVIRETSLPALDARPSHVVADDSEARLQKIAELRRRQAALTAEMEKPKRELNALLAHGPFDLAYGVVEGTPHNARLQMRGEPDKPGDEIPRGFLEILGGSALPKDISGSGRLELAQWLARPDNPLPARVLVNRLWQHHFGQGLVKTPNDFGTRGQRPTHPELLDHLAALFIQSGWSIKAMHRLILSSAVYQQASAGQSAAWSNDEAARPGPKEPKAATLSSMRSETTLPDTFSPFPRRRLSAEEIRDSILFVSGQLDQVPGQGHPFPTPTSWGYTQHAPFTAVYDHNKRSVYLMTQRIKRHPFLALFDGADPNASTPERRPTTVPTQALFFLNDPFVHTKSEKLAAHLQRPGADAAQRVELAYRLTLGRSPSDAERAEATEFLAAYRAELGKANPEKMETVALAAYVRVLFGSNEFLNID